MSSLLDKYRLQKIQQRSIGYLLDNIPYYTKRSILYQYQKQLIETRSVIYHKHAEDFLPAKELRTPEEKKAFVISYVAREFWTNFCVQGQDTPMLRHLQKELCKVFNAQYTFLYMPGSIELVIIKNENNETVSISRDEHLAIINKAWDICQDVVSSYIT